MCRFLLVKSSQPIKPQQLLEKFAAMAEKSRAFDGDWQGDGWGISWLDENNNWQIKKSLQPVWKDSHLFPTFPETMMFAVHARSASFPEHKNNLDFNQPFISSKYSYVFNGLLKGVSLPSTLPGIIGAQKIWSLLQLYLKRNSVEDALKKLESVVVHSTKNAQAMNIGLIDKKNIYALCHYSNHPDYYQLRYYNGDNLKIICSEVLEGFDFETAISGEINSF